MLAVTTALSASLAAVTASLAILSVVTARFCILAVLTVLSPGVGILTAEPICTMNILAPDAKLEPNIIVLLSTSAKPSVGALVPVLAFWITPSILTISWAALLTLAALPELLDSLKSYVAILPFKVGAPLPPADRGIDI